MSRIEKEKFEIARIDLPVRPSVVSPIQFLFRVFRQEDIRF